MSKEKYQDYVKKEGLKAPIEEQVAIKHFRVLIVHLKVFPADQAVVSGFIKLFLFVLI